MAAWYKISAEKEQIIRKYARKADDIHTEFELHSEIGNLLFSKGVKHRFSQPLKKARKFANRIRTS